MYLVIVIVGHVVIVIVGHVVIVIVGHVVIVIVGHLVIVIVGHVVIVCVIIQSLLPGLQTIRLTAESTIFQLWGKQNLLIRRFLCISSYVWPFRHICNPEHNIWELAACRFAPTDVPRVTMVFQLAASLVISKVQLSCLT